MNAHFGLTRLRSMRPIKLCLEVLSVARPSCSLMRLLPQHHTTRMAHSWQRVGANQLLTLNFTTRQVGKPADQPWLRRSVTTTVRAKSNADGNPMQLLVSDAAGKQLSKVQQAQNKPDLMLRVIVESGGCYGFQYKFQLTEETTSDDAIFENSGGKVVIDDISLSLLEGAKIDYVTELIGSTFQVVDIPKATSGCGCGASFDIDL